MNIKHFEITIVFEHGDFVAKCTTAHEALALISDICEMIPHFKPYIGLDNMLCVLADMREGQTSRYSQAGLCIRRVLEDE